MIDHSENLRVGDLVKFWDYENGGHVMGVIVKISSHKFRSDQPAFPSIDVMHKNQVQTIPLDDEWVSLVSSTEGSLC